MGRGKSIPVIKRGQIIALWQDGASDQHISEQLEVHIKSVRSVINKFKETNTLEDLERSGRPRATTPREDRHLRLLSRREKFLTAEDLWKQTDLGVTSRTVRNRLNEAGLFSHPAAKRPITNKRIREQRMGFAKSQPNTYYDWDHFIFMDEKTWQLGSEHVLVRRFDWERFSPECVHQVTNHPPSFSTWGCITRFGIGVLTDIEDTLTAEQYIDILSQSVPNSLVLNAIGDESLIAVIQDNSTVHTANLTKIFMEANPQLKFVKLPPHSPDLNPIENVWGYVVDKVEARKPKNLQDLKAAVHEEWNNVPYWYIVNIYKSMPERIKTVVEKKGYCSSKY